MNATATETAPTTLETIPTAQPAAPAPKSPGIHLLPLNLGRLAVHADPKGGIAKFALQCVNVAFQGDRFTASATDTKHLAHVEGPTVADAARDYPSALIPALAHAPNGEAGSMVPAPAWSKVFASAAKLKLGRAAKTNYALASVACVTGRTVTTFGATNGENALVESAQNTEGKFPPVDSILKDTARNFADAQAEGKGVEFSVDALMLAELLKTAAQFSPEYENNRVTFRVTKGTSAFTVTAQSGDTKFTGLIMPLTS